MIKLKIKKKKKTLSSFPTLWDPMNYIACQAPLYMEFSRQEYLESIPVPFSKGIFLTQGSNTGLLHCRQIFSREPPKDHRFYQFYR